MRTRIHYSTLHCLQCNELPSAKLSSPATADIRHSIHVISIHGPASPAPAPSFQARGCALSSEAASTASPFPFARSTRLLFQQHELHQQRHSPASATLKYSRSSYPARTPSARLYICHSLRVRSFQVYLTLQHSFANMAAYDI